MSYPAARQGLRLTVNGNKMTPLHFTTTGEDTNANQPELGEGTGHTGNQSSSPLPPLVSQSDAQDKLLIWGTEEEEEEEEQHGVDRDLQEFELLESQEMSTYLREGRGEEERSAREAKDEGPMSISSSSTASSASLRVRRVRNDNDSAERERGRVEEEREAEREQGRMEEEKRRSFRSSEDLDAYTSFPRERRDVGTEASDRDREQEKRRSYRSSEDLDSCFPRSGEESERGMERPGGGRERERGGLKETRCRSENNVFLTSLSSLPVLSNSLASALNPSGPPQPPTSKYKTSAPIPGSVPGPAQTRRTPSVDENQNSPPYQEAPYPEPLEQEVLPYQDSWDRKTQEERHLHGNGVSPAEGGLAQRRKGAFEERPSPPRRQQLVRPLCQTETARGRSHAGTMADPRQAARRCSPSPSPSPELSRKANMERSEARAACQQAQREARSLGRLPATAGRTSSPSTNSSRTQPQLGSRRPCSSPGRAGGSSTPTHSPHRTPQGSPRRQPSMYTAPPRSAATGSRPGYGYGSTGPRPSPKTTASAATSIPKPPCHAQQSPPSPRSTPTKSPPKPKGVRPKIITYIRKSPQIKPQAAEGPYQVSSLPSRLSTYAQSHSGSPHTHTPKDPSPFRGSPPVLSASNLLYEKYQQEMQKNTFFPGGPPAPGVRPPNHTHTVPPAHAHVAGHAHPHVHTHSHTAPPKLGGKAESFYDALMDKYLPSETGRALAGYGGRPVCEDPPGPRMAAQMGGSGSLLRSARGLRPQLGLGAVARTTPGAAKAGRSVGQSQRSTTTFSQPVQAVSPATNPSSQSNTDSQTRSSPPQLQPQGGPRSLLPKPGQSGLRPPGFCSSRLPPGRLAAFGFVRSSSVSSASSSHSVESTCGDPRRSTHRLSVSEEPPLHRVTSGIPPCGDHLRPGGPSLQPPSTPALPRRYLPPQPRGSPGVGRKDFQRGSEITRSLPSSPKRLAVVPPKPQSPVQSRQRPAATVRGSVPSSSPQRVAPFRQQQEQQESLQREKEEAQRRERDREAEERERERESQREEVQRLQSCCEQQEERLRSLREELRRTAQGLEVFIITTQHYCHQVECASLNEKELNSEIQRIRSEVAANAVQWERLQREKEELEAGFERELQELQQQQEAELAAVEAGLRKCHSSETEHLLAEHQSEVEELRAHQQEQVEELTINHQAAVQELRDMHNITMATLHEEHVRTVRDLRKAHEQQKIILEENFEKLRLTLQDQVDTLTFQNQSLRDRAKRFEEALRRSTDEQIVEALAPYQHIDEELKSLKEVVEMKNQQIHQQERKISDLEKVAQKNVFLEEKVQVLQQQNEDLMARIDKNLALSRQLSEENANLQGSVEKESSEKKRLSRNNEELLWRLQTSPLMSPSSSPIHRSFSSSPMPSSPFFSSSPPGGAFGSDSPSHCCGYPVTASHCLSPAHRAAANQNLSPGPVTTPTHRAATNQNFSPGPSTPTHRGSANHCQSPGHLNPLQR